MLCLKKSNGISKIYIFNLNQKKGKQVYNACFFRCFIMDSKVNSQLGISIDEARKMLGIGRNLMLELVKVEGFPAVKFKRKIIINKELLPKWFAENCGQYGGY